MAMQQSPFRVPKQGRNKSAPSAKPAPGQTNPIRPSAAPAGADANAQQPEAQAPKKPRHVSQYMELVETVARVEYSRLPNHLIDFSELVNIGAIALHVLFTSNPEREFNITYMSTAIKWAIRNELRNRYKWYAMRQSKEASDDNATANTGDDGEDAELSAEELERHRVREAIYETILSVDSMLEGENPHELKDDAHTPEEVSELKEVAKVVREAIAKLPPRERQVIEARFYKNMKMREIGLTFGISPSRTSRVVQSGLDKIKLELQRRGYA